MKILGIESSHDDASIAILEDNQVKIMLTLSQIDIHKKFGGTVPEIASREHSQNLAYILDILINKYQVDFSTLDIIAYTKEPGLLGSLQMGFLLASAIAMLYNKPLIPVNHLKGHFWSAAINNNIQFPCLSLLISGGHSQLIYAKNEYDLEVLGSTKDDALGEIYDKIARKLNLGFPGGPIIDNINKSVDFKQLIDFSIPKIFENPYDFSFSGIKTQVINYVNKTKAFDDDKLQKLIAVSFQKTIIKYLKRQIDLVLRNFDVKSITLVGGVAANSEIRSLIESYSNQYQIVIPEKKYCTDNGAMIAIAAQYTKNTSEVK
ncbi:tRNA (adenosine(37)-N6)-threonylcarbamoyltransferase complex transferase subunit TsaD [Mesomycoplasma conjunctivae]|uniref:tRNA (adenosine(37)-N6)-threonylcarbamoyltransferase complex transferase subunit TsaD n=1 Tax=Mesomycoplasma conjunctivae TaxID=45361 RepID=UPI003DA3B8F4